MLCYNLSNVVAYSDVLDGLLVTGISTDIDPFFYGEKIAHKATNPRPKKTQFEWAITKKMLDMNKPVLGINNGMQIINVVMGGTLCQTLSVEPQDAYNHQQQTPLIFPHHEVILDKNTNLYEYIGEACSNAGAEDGAPQSIILETNSYHRQAIKTLGARLRAGAISRDNVVESIESTELRFCVGVQWNAEFFVTAADRALFKAFIVAAAGGEKAPPAKTKGKAKVANSARQVA
jgi:putative glutamine amidotransferase